MIHNKLIMAGICVLALVSGCDSRSMTGLQATEESTWDSQIMRLTYRWDAPCEGDPPCGGPVDHYQLELHTVAGDTLAFETLTDATQIQLTADFAPHRARVRGIGPDGAIGEWSRWSNQFPPGPHKVPSIKQEQDHD